MMHKKHHVYTHNGIPDDETHDGIGTSAGIRLFDCINTWKAFVSVLALCLIINGLLFYLS
jgi:hypothetical protein